ncbi:type VII secretion target [Glycomyces buryatensis]|nr:type VII secretion target [Glycomyces buryatensis]
MSDYSVDTDALTEAAQAVRSSADQAAEVAEYAREADPDLWTWGYPGVMLAAPFYFAIAEILHGRLAEVRTAIEGYADLVVESAEAYRAADDEAAADLAALGGELGGA